MDFVAFDLLPVTEAREIDVADRVDVLQFRGQRPLSGDDLFHHHADRAQGCLKQDLPAQMIDDSAIVATVKLQALADQDDIDIRGGQLFPAVTARLDQTDFLPRFAADLLAHPRPGTLFALRLTIPFPADVDEVVGYGLLVHQMQGAFRLAVDRVNGLDQKAGIAERFQESLPGALFGMVEGEDQQAVIRQRFAATPPYGRQAVLVVGGGLPPRGVFDDLLHLGGHLRGEVWVTLRQDQPKPDIKEIGQLRVIDVAGVGGIGDDEVETVLFDMR